MNNKGFTFIELLFVLTLTIFMIWITLPLLEHPIENYETKLFINELNEQVNLLQLKNYRTEIEFELIFHKTYYEIISHDYGIPKTSRFYYPHHIMLRNNHPSALTYQENGVLKNPQTVVFIQTEINETVSLIFPFGKSGFYVK